MIDSDVKYIVNVCIIVAVCALEAISMWETKWQATGMEWAIPGLALIWWEAQ